MHNHHESLPGFHVDQIWYDGCSECEYRGQNLPNSLGTLDLGNLHRAWVRAGTRSSHGVAHESSAERPLLQMLWMVQLCLENLCGLKPGEIPLPLAQLFAGISPDT